MARGKRLSTHLFGRVCTNSYVLIPALGWTTWSNTIPCLNVKGCVACGRPSWAWCCGKQYWAGQALCCLPYTQPRAFPTLSTEMPAWVRRENGCPVSFKESQEAFGLINSATHVECWILQSSLSGILYLYPEAIQSAAECSQHSDQFPWEGSNRFIPHFSVWCLTALCTNPHSYLPWRKLISFLLRVSTRKHKHHSTTHTLCLHWC